MATSIAYIRKHKAPLAKIGRRVTYAGHPYRVAWTHHDGLILRSELTVHANDPYLDYEPPLSTTEASNARYITQLELMLYEMTSRGDWIKNGHNVEIYDRIVAAVEAHEAMMRGKPGDRREG